MRYQIAFLSIILFWLTIFNATGVYAKDIYPKKCQMVQGVASLKGVSEQFARRMAIRDALKNASLQNNIKVSSDQQLNNFVLEKDITRFSSQSRVSSFKVLKEGVKKLSFDQQFDRSGMPIENKKALNYQVTLNVCLTEDPSVCGNALGNYLQPKLAVAQVLLADAYAARDIANLRSGYQLALKSHLEKQGYKNIELLHSGTHLQDAEQILSPNLSKAVLDPIRNQTGAQYLLLSVIGSVTRHNESNKVWSRVKSFYNHSVDPNARYIEVESFVVDLVSRQVVFQQKRGFDVKGKVTVGRDRPFGTNAFYATDTGIVFHALLKQTSGDLFQHLKCKPLKSQIIDSREGEYMLLLSSESGVRVGDEMTVYHKFGRSVTYGGVNLGFDSKPAGFLKIIRTHSKFSVAELITKDGLVQVGDEVLSW